MQMRHRCVICVCLLAGAGPLTPACAQERIGPTAAVGFAWGPLYGGNYSATWWTGFRAALTLPIYHVASLGAVVLDVTADRFWNGNGDDCVIRPPDSNCVPDPPPLTALTIGWRQVLGGSRATLYVGAGRMSGQGEVTAAGLARVELAIPSAYAGLFGQYALIPSFQNRTLQTLLWGLNLSLH